MGFVETVDTSPTATQASLRGLATAASRPDPLGDPITEGPGFFETAWNSIQANSISGNIGQRFGMSAIALSRGISNERDEDFNVYDHFDAIIKDHPYMLEDFESGRVLDIPNKQRLDLYVWAKGRDFNIRQRAGEGGFGANLVGAAGGDIGLFAAGGTFMASTRTGQALLKAYKGTSLVKKLAVAGAGGAAGNVAFDLAVDAINPANSNEVSIVEAVKWGGLIGAAVPLVGAGARGLAHLMPSPVLARMQKEAAKAFAEPIADDARAFIKNEVDSMGDLLKEAPTGPLTISTIRHPDIDPLIEKAQKKWARAGHKLEVTEHPQQQLVDWTLGMKALDEALGDDLAKLSGVSNKAAEGLSAPLPSGRIRKSVSSVTRGVYRMLFDDAVPTKETVDDPLGAVNNPSAESLQRGYDNVRDTIKIELDQAYRGHFKGGGKPIDVVLSDGTPLHIGRIAGGRKFSQAVRDLLVQEDQIKRGMRSSLTFEPTPAMRKAAKSWGRGMNDYLAKLDEAGMLQGPQSLKRAQKELGELENLHSAADDPAKRFDLSMQILRKQDEIAGIKTVVDRADLHVSRRWLSHEIRRDEGAFKKALLTQFRRNREVDVNTGRTLADAERPIIAEALDRLDDETRQIVSELRFESEFADLVTSVRQKYELAVDKYMRSSADGVFKQLTNVEHAHGIETAFAAGSPFKGRVLQVDEGSFRKYIDNDLYSIADFYNQAVSGKAAIATSIRRNAGTLQPMVKQLLNEDLDYTADQIVRAVQEDFQRLKTAAGNVDKLSNSKLQKLIDKSERDTIDILNAKSEELIGRNLNPSSLAADVGWSSAGRIAMRVPFMAYMGRVVVSSIMDLAAVANLTGKSPGKLRSIAQALTPFKEFPRIGLEAIAAAADEGAARHMSIWDIRDIPADPRAARGPIGRTVARADQVTDAMARGVGKFSGMNWWNRNLRRATGHFLMQEGVAVMKKMIRADDLVSGGLKTGAALERVGLSKELAQRWNRLGITPSRSRRIMKHLRESGEDLQGNRLANLSDDEFAKFNGYVNPNFKRWADSDRELMDVFTSAIDTEIRNIIADPKVLSRPLMNRHMMGRLFNQFWSFGFAWGSQVLPVAAQGSSMQFSSFMLGTVGLGALSDSIHNHLSGRRSFDDSAAEWEKNPLGMTYAATLRSGALSWLARPMELMDKSPYGMGSLLGNNVSSLHSGQALSTIGLMGPTVDALDRIVRGGINPLLSGKGYDARSAHTLRTVMPYQNLLGLSALHRFTSDAGLNNPFGRGKGLDLFPLPTLPERDLTREKR